jgi:Tfp pilus assembly protein PilZ
MRHERHRTSIPAEFSAGRLQGTGQIKNLSEGGLFVGTGSLPAQGETVELCFTVPGGSRIELSGMVWWTTADSAERRHRQTGFGLRLLEENDAYRTWVATLLR